MSVVWRLTPRPRAGARVALTVRARSISTLVAAGTLPLLVAGTTGSARAQAWTPLPGTGSVNVSYQYTHVTKHLFSENVESWSDENYTFGPGNRGYMGDVFGQSVGLHADFSPRRGFGISAGLAYVSAQYIGPFPETETDNGEYVGDLQDLTLGIRHMTMWGELAITPFVGLRLPVVDYPSAGHAAVGLGLAEFMAGLSVGRTFTPWLPNLFAQASYARVFVENVDEFDLDRDRVTVDAGYVIAPWLSIGGGYLYSRTSDGIDWVTDLETEEEFGEHWHNHDVAARERLHRVHAYVAVPLRGSVTMSLGYIGNVQGANSHLSDAGTIGLSWGFRTPLAR